MPSNGTADSPDFHGPSEPGRADTDANEGSRRFGPPWEGSQHHSTHQNGDRNIHVSGDSHGGIHQYTASFSLHEELARSVFRRSAAPRPVNPDSLRQLDELFVAPDGYDRAKRILEARNTVVVTGDLGTGRRSAAMKLLFDTTMTSHEVSADPDDEVWLDPNAVGPREGLLFDLSGYSPEDVRSALARSEEFRARVANKQCRLTLVVPHEAEHLLTDDLARHVVQVGRPDGRRVLEKHLVAESIECTDLDLDSGELHLLVRSARMAELDRLSRLVREAKSTGEDGDFARWLKQALHAFSRRTEQVATWLREHPGGDERALILAAAMLDGASTDAIFAATNTLLKTVKFPDEDTHVLERAGIAGRLRKLDISVDDNRTVRFDTLNFDHEVRTHFWAEYPDLRTKLREWLGRTAQQPELDQWSRTRLVVRLAEQCLITGRPGDLTSLAKQWVTSGNSRVLGCAELVLEVGLLDEQYGSTFRRKIYRRAIRASNELPHQLDDTLIRLCARVITESHPDQALVRLHQFARRGGENAQLAVDHIVGLAEQGSFFRRVLYRLSDELASRGDPQDVYLFLRIADPWRLAAEDSRSQALISDRGVHRQLVYGWQAVMAHPTPTWDARGQDWLQAASDAPRHTALLDVLVDACNRRTASLSRLHGLALRWVRSAHGAERQQRSRTAAHLVERIDVVQDLEFLTTTGEPTR